MGLDFFRYKLNGFRAKEGASVKYSPCHTELDSESDGAWASRTPLRFEMPNQVRHDTSLRSARHKEKADRSLCPSERSEESKKPIRVALLRSAGQRRPKGKCRNASRFPGLKTKHSKFNTALRAPRKALHHLLFGYGI